jgi:hypothetical protein
MRALLGERRKRGSGKVRRCLRLRPSPPSPRLEICMLGGALSREVEVEGSPTRVSALLVVFILHNATAHLAAKHDAVRYSVETAPRSCGRL